ncbi:hypothetical protein ACIA03_08640 [Nocardioides sp. NPDC051685]|uniref:hypothetical protein n=1 Tax=Nocardioides sp. NPDC051685 TaxID=3364334 RepID=UPI0037BACD46
MYGENAARLRAELTGLLRQTHINHRILRDISRTPSPLNVEAHRLEAAAQIGRYRRAVLAWCHQVLVQTDPKTVTNLAHSALDPPGWLALSLNRVLDATPGNLPTMADLATTQDIRPLEAWRQAAKATVLAEGDFDHGLGRGLLDHREWLTVVGDVCDITQALLVLDARYEQLPGWTKLRGARGLARYAADCATHAQALYGAPDYNIDWRGWHPPPPDLPPDADVLSQVLAAEHRLLNSLTAIPSMANLRILFTSERGLSDLAAVGARNTAPEQAAMFRRRERAYRNLSRASRTAAGLAGTGTAANPSQRRGRTRSRHLLRRQPRYEGRLAQPHQARPPCRQSALRHDRGRLQQAPLPRPQRPPPHRRD